jgi:hypothetical protein
MASIGDVRVEGGSSTMALLKGRWDDSRGGAININVVKESGSSIAGE